MKEYPILFSTDMVRAILDGIKTMTRRVIKPQPHKSWDETPYLIETSGQWCFHGHDGWGYKKCPYGQVGDRLWVRETWAIIRENDNVSVPDMSQNSGLYFKADNTSSTRIGKWRPSIFMPRWASRITLEITEVRAERLQEITEEEAKTEGCESAWEILGGNTTARYAFSELWDFLNAKRGYGWEVNPWVWVILFELM